MIQTVGKRLLVEMENDNQSQLLGSQDIGLYRVIAVGDEVKNITTSSKVAVNVKNIMSFKFSNKKYYMTNEESVLLYFDKEEKL